MSPILQIGPNSTKNLDKTEVKWLGNIFMDPVLGNVNESRCDYLCEAVAARQVQNARGHNGEAVCVFTDSRSVCAQTWSLEGRSKFLLSSFPFSVYSRSVGWCLILEVGWKQDVHFNHPEKSRKKIDWLNSVFIEPEWRLGKFAKWGDLVKAYLCLHPFNW